MMNMQDFKIVKKGRVYHLTDPDHPEESYKVQKPNGKIVWRLELRDVQPEQTVYKAVRISR